MPTDASLRARGAVGVAHPTIVACTSDRCHSQNARAGRERNPLASSSLTNSSRVGSMVSLR